MSEGRPFYSYERLQHGVDRQVQLDYICAVAAAEPHLQQQPKARMALQYLFFWNLKTPQDNEWRPFPGQNPTKYLDNLPLLLKRTDLEATVVDTAPVVAGVGGLAHMSQIHAFGFTAPASVFRNVKTMMAMHRTVLLLSSLILACQAAGFQYRMFIPRWCHDRERTRDEVEVRKHVDAGMLLGGGIWVTRLLFKVGLRWWAPIDIVAGGALADLMHREYLKAHGYEPR